VTSFCCQGPKDNVEKIEQELDSTGIEISFLLTYHHLTSYHGWQVSFSPSSLQLLSVFKPIGTKRSVDETGPTTRASKAAKTDTSTSPATKAAKGGKKGAKVSSSLITRLRVPDFNYVSTQAAIPTSAFKAKALPLHVVLTHTPPAIPDAEAVPSATADPGFIGALTLVASSFSTGSYGWKGNKRITVELQNPEGGEQNEKEKVQVMLTCVFLLGFALCFVPDGVVM